MPDRPERDPDPRRLSKRGNTRCAPRLCDGAGCSPTPGTDTERAKRTARSRLPPSHPAATIRRGHSNPTRNAGHTLFSAQIAWLNHAPTGECDFARASSAFASPPFAFTLDSRPAPTAHAKTRGFTREIDARHPPGDCDLARAGSYPRSRLTG